MSAETGDAGQAEGAENPLPDGEEEPKKKRPKWLILLDILHEFIIQVILDRFF